MRHAWTHQIPWNDKIETQRGRGAEDAEDIAEKNLIYCEDPGCGFSCLFYTYFQKLSAFLCTLRISAFR